MANSGPVVIASDQSPVSVTLSTLPALVAGSAIVGKVGIDQTTPGTTNRVSIGVDGTVVANIGTAGSLALDTTLTTGSQKTKIVDSLGTNAVSVSVGGALKVDNSAVTQPVSLAALPALIAGAAIIGKVGIDQTTPGTTNLVQVGGSLPTGANTIGAVNIAAAQTIAVTQATAANLNITATPIALTKGTQGATGFTVQNLIDAGRVPKQIFLDSFAVAAAAETLMTMSYSSANGTATTGTSYNVTAGKTFRLQQITCSLHTITGNTTAVNIVVRIRVNNGGAGIISSPIQYVIPVQGVAAANQSTIAVVIPIPDGHEFPAGAGIAVTVTCSGFVATTAAPKADINLTGYEY